MGESPGTPPAWPQRGGPEFPQTCFFALKKKSGAREVGRGAYLFPRSPQLATAGPLFSLPGAASVRLRFVSASELFSPFLFLRSRRLVLARLRRQLLARYTFSSFADTTSFHFSLVCRYALFSGQARANFRFRLILFSALCVFCVYFLARFLRGVALFSDTPYFEPVPRGEKVRFFGVLYVRVRK